MDLNAVLPSSFSIVVCFEVQILIA